MREKAWSPSEKFAKEAGNFKVAFQHQGGSEIVIWKNGTVQVSETRW